MHPIIPIIGIGILLTIAFAAGWNLSVYRFTGRQKELAAKYEVMATNWHNLAEQLQKDPTRAAIDLGKASVLNDMQQLCDDIRATLEGTPNARM